MTSVDAIIWADTVLLIYHQAHRADEELFNTSSRLLKPLAFRVHHSCPQESPLNINMLQLFPQLNNEQNYIIPVVFFVLNSITTHSSYPPIHLPFRFSLAHSSVIDHPYRIKSASNIFCQSKPNSSRDMSAEYLMSCTGTLLVWQEQNNRPKTGSYLTTWQNYINHSPHSTYTPLP